MWDTRREAQALTPCESTTSSSPNPSMPKSTSNTWQQMLQVANTWQEQWTMPSLLCTLTSTGAWGLPSAATTRSTLKCLHSSSAVSTSTARRATARLTPSIVSSLEAPPSSPRRAEAERAAGVRTNVAMNTHSALHHFITCMHHEHAQHTHARHTHAPLKRRSTALLPSCCSSSAP